MNIVERVKNILVTPKTEWDVIAAEATPPKQLIISYVLPLAAIAAIAGFISYSLIGMSMFGVTVRTPIVWGIVMIVYQIVMAVVSIFILGFIKHGPKFLSLFWVPGMGIFGGAAMVVIEMISYFVRPVTLALRLFGNMLGGHVVMSLFGSFVVALGILALSGGVATLAFVPSALSFTLIVGLTGLELVVAILQAFVFAALATVYLNEVVNFGHGH